MNRKLEIINGLRVSKCGARFVGVNPFPAVAMETRKEVIPETKTESKPEKVKKNYFNPVEPEPAKGKDSLFDFRKDHRGSAEIEDEQ